jgi:hypothetical protein
VLLKETFWGVGVFRSARVCAVVALFTCDNMLTLFEFTSDKIPI